MTANLTALVARLLELLAKYKPEDGIAHDHMLEAYVALPALLDAIEAKDAALKKCQAHLADMRGVWQRGDITDHKGRSGYLSNMNVECEVAVRQALGGSDDN